MKLKKLVIFGIMSATLLAQSTIVFADSSVTTEKSDASVASKFSYQTGVAIVSIPTDLSLSKDEAQNAYTNAGQLSAYGDIDERLKLKVKASHTIDYTSDDTDVTGDVYFGTGDNVAYWSADQLKAGVASASAKATQAVTIKVGNANQIESKEYSGNLTFDIGLVDKSEFEDLSETDESKFTYKVITSSTGLSDTFSYKTGVDTTDTVEYTPKIGTVVITGLTSEALDEGINTIVTPKTIDGKKVTAIAMENIAYSGAKKLYVSEGVE